MKQVWVKRAACSATAETTRGAALPTLVTAMPEPRSISELPSTSTSTPPPARSTKTGSAVPTPAGTADVRRAISSIERGPGMSVTRCRRWAIPPVASGGVASDRVSSIAEPLPGSVSASGKNSIVPVPS